MQRVVQLILLIWFGLISVFFVWAAAGLLLSSTPSLDQPPNRPAAPVAEALPPLDFTKDLKTQIDAIQARVTRFTHQAAVYKDEVGAYTQQTTAYRTYLETAGKAHANAAYQLVLEKVLIPFLNTFLAALIAYAFGKVTANIAYNWFASRNAGQNAGLKEVEL
ncbi:MAG TPA: hypothetical protein VFS20_16040 [Longimicrobium sp.]|nr:hypothetical protein [Longimicrobium sp.]